MWYFALDTCARTSSFQKYRYQQVSLSLSFSLFLYYICILACKFKNVTIYIYICITICISIWTPMIYLELFSVGLPIQKLWCDPIRNQWSSSADDYPCVFEKGAKTCHFTKHIYILNCTGNPHF